MFITTVANPTVAIVDRAISASQLLGVPYIERLNKTVVQMQREKEDFETIVVYATTSRLVRLNQPDLFYHPSMGHVRIKRMLNGEIERMIAICDIKQGDKVIDCTAGLCSDSLVFSHAVGEQGTVIAIESNPILFTIMSDGLNNYEGELSEVVEAGRRINLLHADHFQYLSQCSDKSVDVVYFDPMFDEPLHDSQSMQPLRGIANEQHLTTLTIEQAIRVAKKRVVMKNNRGSHTFANLGFESVIHGGTNISYGVIEVE
jgi:16S rRNA G966 N2-methylase RsmD